MRSTLAFALFWINLIVASINIYFSVQANINRDFSPRPRSYNLRGTKENLLKINPNYFLEKEIETPKELRHLTIFDTRLIMLLVDIGAFFFLMLLISSFCVTENECCSNDENTRTNFAVGSCYGTCVCLNSNDCGGGSINCNCSGNGGLNNCGQAGIVIAVLLFFVIIFIALFCAAKACGKHVSRIVAIILLFLTNVALTTLALISGIDKFCILIAGFSSFAAVCDLLGILLPNFGCCVKLSYGYRCSLNPINPEPKLDLVPSDDETVDQAMIQSEVEPKFEKPYAEENYPEPQEVMQVPIDNNPAESTPIYNEQNQDLDANGNAFDAPAPVYQEKNDN